MTAGSYRAYRRKCFFFHSKVFFQHLVSILSIIHINTVYWWGNLVGKRQKEWIVMRMYGFLWGYVAHFTSYLYSREHRRIFSFLFPGLFCWEGERKRGAAEGDFSWKEKWKSKMRRGSLLIDILFFRKSIPLSLSLSLSHCCFSFKSSGYFDVCVTISLRQISRPEKHTASLVFTFEVGERSGMSFSREDLGHLSMDLFRALSFSQAIF